MKIYIILPIIAFLVNGFTFTYVYAQKTFSKESKAYLLYSSVLAIWIGMQIYEMLPVDFMYPKMIFKLDTACWLTIGLLFLNFVYKFLDRKLDYSFYAFSFIVFLGHVFNLSTDLLISGWRIAESGLRGQEGPFYIYAAILVTVTPCIYALALIYTKSKKVKEFNEKKQLQMLFWGSALTVVIGSVFDLYVSFQPPFNTGYTSTPTIVVLQSFLIFLAIIRYKFLTLSVSDIANEIFYSIEEAVMILNSKGQIVTCNLSAQKMFQISCNEYDGMHISKLLPQFDYQNVSNLEFCINLNGGMRFLAISKSSIKADKNELGYVLIIKDNTSREHMQKQVILSSKLASIGELAASVAHEINNPLTIIRGNLDIIKDVIDEDKIQNTYISDAMLRQDRAITRIVNIVKSLKNYARMDISENEVVDLHKAISDTLFLIETIFIKSNVKISCSLNAEETYIDGNIGKLQQVIMNILTNARDSLVHKNGGTIKIETLNTDNQILLKITDNGPGICDSYSKRLFEPFFTTKPPGKGTGLGLSITKAIVDSMKGSVSFVSEKDKATTFTVAFPIVQGSHLPKIEKNKSKLDIDKLYGRVIVVDDEGDIRTVVKKYLTDTKCDIDEAEDGIDALEKIKFEKYDIVITDLMMPKMNGEVLVQEIKKLGGKPPKFILITGGISTEDNSEELDNLIKSVDGFLRKPFTKEELYQILVSFKN